MPGSIATYQELLRTMLADSTTFRAWVGATTQAQAKSRIHMHELRPPEDRAEYTPDELNAMRPFAILAPGDDDPFDTFADAASTGEVYDWDERGSFDVVLEEAIPKELWKFPDVMKGRLFDTIDGLITDLRTMIGKAGYLNATRIRVRSVRATDELQDDPEPASDNVVMALIQFFYGEE